MNNQNLIIYQFNPLYQILKELEQDLNFKIIESLNEKSLNNQIEKLNNYLIITKKKILNVEYQLVFEHLPIKIFKLIEKLNIEFLKKQFSDQSEIIINDYKINLNSREMLFNNTKLKLTEKEVNTIIYLFKIKSSTRRVCLFFKKIIISYLYMNNQNLIIYQFNSLYQILKELEKDLNFSIIESLNEKSLHNKIKNLDNYLVITKKKKFRN